MAETIFKPGDIIVPMSKPFLKVLNISCKGRFCDNCYKAGDLQRCSGCSRMHYCGKSCQREDWKEGHSVECKSDVFKNPTVNEAEPEMFSKLLRTLAKFQRSPESFTENYGVYGNKQRCFNDLMSHEENFRANPSTLILAPLLKRLQTQDSSFGLMTISAEFLLKIFGTWRINSFSMIDGEDSIGSGLYIPHSVFDHSCRPNSVEVCKEGKHEIRCIHPIRKGEEPTISYLTGNRDPIYRRTVLQNCYYFLCTCELCTAEKNEPLVDYENLRSQRPNLRMTYCFKSQDQGLYLFRKLYHEYDERITQFCLSAFIQLHMFQTSGEDVPMTVLRNIATDVEKRLKITFGSESNEYAKFLQMVGELGIRIDNGK